MSWIGARVEAGGTRFRVWASTPAALELDILTPERRPIVLERDAAGYAETYVAGLGAGARYRYRLTTRQGEVRARPDPASRFQPEGVHGSSEVVAVPPLANRAPAWRGPRLATYVTYELHVGAFTAAGTFDAAAGDLPRLRELGVTAVEIMPVAEFPGARNWGYDGTFPYAAHSAYGGVPGLTRLVDACHREGLAVILDAVYNHLGPEGNYLGEFAPYFTRHYRTPWGDAINFDGPENGPVRAYFIGNALYWLRDIGCDALRLDAIHGIYDASAQPFLAELGAAVAAEAARSGRRLYPIAESDLNDSRVLRRRSGGGLGLAAQWSDDFHHAAHALLTGEREGYYADFGRVADLAAAVRDGFVYTGQYSRYRRRRHGNSARGFDPGRFVICTQNHDQVGNRAHGDRLAAQLGHEEQKLAAGLLLLAPGLPLLFMGQEYGETAPFPYFIAHSDAALVAAVRRGRAAETPGAEANLPDPAAVATFEAARLRRERRTTPQGAALESLHRALLRLRPAAGARATVWFDEAARVIAWERDGLYAAFHLGATAWRGAPRLPAGDWELALDSAAAEWLGPGGAAPARLTSPLTLAPHSFAVFRRV